MHEVNYTAIARLEWNHIENNARNILVDDNNYCKML